MEDAKAEGETSTAPTPLIPNRACNRERPCRRCVRLGRAHLCSDVPPRKRGRQVYGSVDAGDGGGSGSGETSPSLFDADAASEQASVDGEEDASHNGSSSSSKPKRKRSRKKANSVNDHDSTSTTTTTASLVGENPPQLAAIEHKFDLVTQLLHTMAGEMKQMRHTNDALIAELQHTQAKLRDTEIVVSDLLRREQQRDEDKQHRGAEKKRRKDARAIQDSLSLSSTPSSSPTLSALVPQTASNGSRSSFSFELSMLQSGVSPAVILEARKQLPWLCHYDISPSRFAVVDFSHPVYVCEKLSSLEVPSFISYVNEAFVRLSKYSWSELIGMPFSKIFTGHERYLSQFAALLYNQPPLTAGIVFSYSPLMRRKDGKLLRLKDRSQAFYNHHGQAQYSVKCIVDWEEGSLREGEGFDRWVPPRPRVDAPPLGDSGGGSSALAGGDSGDSSPIDNAALVLADELTPRATTGTGGISLIASTCYHPSVSSSTSSSSSSTLPSSASSTSTTPGRSSSSSRAERAALPVQPSAITPAQHPQPHHVQAHSHSHAQPHPYSHQRQPALPPPQQSSTLANQHQNQAFGAARAWPS